MKTWWQAILFPAFILAIGVAMYLPDIRPLLTLLFLGFLILAAVTI